MAKTIKARDLIKKIGSNLQFQKRQKVKNRDQVALAARYADEQSYLLEELKFHGHVANSIWDLVNTRNSYSDAIPILLKHLSLPYSDRTREGIARALAIPEAAKIWGALLAEYEKSPPQSDVKRGLAVALSVACSDDVVEELAAAARDVRNGESRLLLLSGLRKSRSRTAQDALTILAEDPVLRKEITAQKKKKARVGD